MVERKVWGLKFDLFFAMVTCFVKGRPNRDGSTFNYGGTDESWLVSNAHNAWPEVQSEKASPPESQPQCGCK